ncbi:hypothetical protein B2J93_7948 [Marssonina coronariae]|uniref:Uncharacterized protein n=1 Tax=Diplocarpon coronariae TaxID=2795749 RepID=A0A218ZAU8_9HELO|nr:hypothetical protein B2J93_7948 [Marssonina coronariae]
MDSHRQDFSLGYRDPASSLIMPPQEAPIPLPLPPLGRQLSGMDGTRPDNRFLGLQAPSQTHTYTIHNPRLRARLTPTQSTIPVSEPDSLLHNPQSPSPVPHGTGHLVFVRNAGFVAEQRRDDSYASAAAAPHAAAGKASGVDRATAVTPVLGVQGGKASPSPPPMRFEAFTEASSRRRGRGWQCRVG